MTCIDYVTLLEISIGMLMDGGELATLGALPIIGHRLAKTCMHSCSSAWLSLSSSRIKWV